MRESVWNVSGFTNSVAAGVINGFLGYGTRIVINGKVPTFHVIGIDGPDGKKVNADEFQYDRPHYIRIAAIGAHYTGLPAWDESVTEIDWDNFPWDQLADDWSNFNDIVVYKTTIIHHPATYASDKSLNPNDMYNYSPVYKLENGTITEVTDW